MRKVKLQYPINVKGQNGNLIECNELGLNRIKLKHLKLLPEDFVEKGENIHPAVFIPLIAGLANISEDEAGEIDFADLTGMVDIIQDFLANTPGVNTGN